MRSAIVLKAVARACLLIIVFASATGGTTAAEQPDREQVGTAMKRAAAYYRSHVARHGGYVYLYSVDLQRRLGEGVAGPDEIWVQPPGTPTVGIAYFKAFEATGDRFYLDAATETAEALVYGQLESGGWRNSIDFDPRGKRAGRYRRGKGQGNNRSSLDDDQTQSALRLLMRVDRSHDFKHEAIHEAARYGLDALLGAQFAIGAFPQSWEKPIEVEDSGKRASYPTHDWRTEGRVKNYWDMYTLNDGLAGSVSKVLIEAHGVYGDERYLNALKRLGDFLVLAQLPDPQPAWSQQYSYKMHPIWARKFEPAAVASRESEDVLETLLAIYEQTGDEKYLAPIPRAIDYLRSSLLTDGRLARFYELQTNRPLYMQRKGQEYSLTYDDTDLPEHYGWKFKPALDEIKTKYQRAKSGQKASNEPRSAKKQATAVQAVVQSLDEEGRWLSVSRGERLIGDHKFAAGEKYLSSAVFRKNLEMLADYLSAEK